MDQDLSLSSRRAFLRRCAQLSLTGTALPLALNLAAMGEAGKERKAEEDSKNVGEIRKKYHVS